MNKHRLLLLAAMLACLDTTMVGAQQASKAPTPHTAIQSGCVTPGATEKRNWFQRRFHRTRKNADLSWVFAPMLICTGFGSPERMLRRWRVDEVRRLEQRESGLRPPCAAAAIHPASAATTAINPAAAKASAKP
jgi:hypothetical protein